MDALFPNCAVSEARTVSEAHFAGAENAESAREFQSQEAESAGKRRTSSTLWKVRQDAWAEG